MASSSGTGHDAAAARPSTGHATTCAITATGYCTCVGADLPVAAPDHDKALGSLVALLETIGQGRALLPNGSLLLEVDADVNDEALWKSNASMLLDQDDLAALRDIPALLAERQQDKEALKAARPFILWAMSDTETADFLPWADALAQVDAALDVEEDAENG